MRAHARRLAASLRTLDGTSRLARRALLATYFALPLVAIGLVRSYDVGQWFFTDDFLWLKAASNPNLPDFLQGAFEFPRGDTPYWRPMVDLYFFGMWRVFSLNATAYHGLNLILHAAIALMLLGSVWRVTRSAATGALAAVLFAVTPSYSTAVVWVSNVTSLLASGFFLATTLLFLLYRERRSHWLLALSMIAFGGALMSKEESAMLLPFLAVIAVAADPPRGRRAWGQLAIDLLPVVGLCGAFLLLQVSKVGVSSHSEDGYSLGWHIFPNFLDRLLWMGVPLHPNYGEWIEPAQWAAMLAALCIAVAGLWRGNWALPALWACTAIALIPSSLFTRDFNPRWMYLATIPWSGFVAMVFMITTRWLSRVNVVIAATSLALALSLLGSVFVPKGMELESRLAVHTNTMQAMEQALRENCPFLGYGSRVLLFPIPVIDPGYATPALVSLLYPGTYTVPVRPPMDPPGLRDCILTSVRLSVQAIPGTTYDASPFWNMVPAPPCPEAIDWSLAESYAGALAMIRGPIIAVHRQSAAHQTVLEIGEAGGFAVVVRDTSDKRLQQLATRSEEFVGSLACASGIVFVPWGTPIIIVDTGRSLAIGSKVIPAATTR